MFYLGYNYDNELINLNTLFLTMTVHGIVTKNSLYLYIQPPSPHYVPNPPYTLINTHTHTHTHTTHTHNTHTHTQHIHTHTNIYIYIYIHIYVFNIIIMLFADVRHT